MELQARMQKMLDGWQTSSDRTEALVGDDTEALSAVNQGLRMEVNQMRQKLLEAEDVILQQDKVGNQGQISVSIYLCGSAH